jgi:hypothetical protein
MINGLKAFIHSDSQAQQKCVENDVKLQNRGYKPDTHFTC